jgi:hypothetical protein
MRATLLAAAASAICWRLEDSKTVEPETVARCAMSMILATMALYSNRVRTVTPYR